MYVCPHYLDTDRTKLKHAEVLRNLAKKRKETQNSLECSVNTSVCVMINFHANV